MHLLRCYLTYDTVSHPKRATLGECKKERIESAEDDQTRLKRMGACCDALPARGFHARGVGILAGEEMAREAFVI